MIRRLFDRYSQYECDSHYVLPEDGTWYDETPAEMIDQKPVIELRWVAHRPLAPVADD